MIVIPAEGCSLLITLKGKFLLHIYIEILVSSHVKKINICISVRCIKHKFNHFARQLQKTMKGIGTDDDALVRVVVSRCEIDLANIKEEFQKLTGQTLDQYISVSHA